MIRIRTSDQDQHTGQNQDQFLGSVLGSEPQNRIRIGIESGSRLVYGTELQKMISIRTSDQYTNQNQYLDKGQDQGPRKGQQQDHGYDQDQNQDLQSG